MAICGRDRARTDAAAEQIGECALPLVSDVGSADRAARFVTAATEALGGLASSSPTPAGRRRATPRRPTSTPTRQRRLCRPIRRRSDRGARRARIVVANAGGPPPGKFAQTDAYRAAIDLDPMSIVGMCKAAIPAMQAQRWGRVVAITSLSVRQPMEQLILSNRARAGATAFSKTLAREVAADGVTVNSAQLGLHRTDRLRAIYGGRLPDRAVAFSCGRSARFITGLAMNVDGGDSAGLR